MLITEFLQALETEVPLSAAGYTRDAIGLQAGLPKFAELTAALFAYEVTSEVIAEAEERGANLIVAFHPLIFPSLDSVTDETRTGALIRNLIKRDIALYIQHTAFDTHPEFGTSRLMAEALGLENIQTLAPGQTRTIHSNDATSGMGAMGKLPQDMERKGFLKLVATAFGSPMLRTNYRAPERISSVALLGGAGMEYYPHAASEKADAFVTADVRYHDFYRADHDNILLIDAGHAETERFVTQGMIRTAHRALDKPFANPDDRKSVEGWDELLLLARSTPNAVNYFVSSR